MAAKPRLKELSLIRPSIGPAHALRRCLAPPPMSGSSADVWLLRLARCPSFCELVHFIERSFNGRAPSVLVIRPRGGGDEEGSGCAKLRLNQDGQPYRLGTGVVLAVSSRHSNFHEKLPAVRDRRPLAARKDCKHEHTASNLVSSTKAMTIVDYALPDADSIHVLLDPLRMSYAFCGKDNRNKLQSEYPRNETAGTGSHLFYL
ncbi:hypothetical protein K505DRAFT_362382 [Melanomma pulvis-pyrius CBS 109.77]|uniref:Uncharacterized protein n=1 Tax=Melanomma pulvis-pyrius CBS 109.77 TaxID=1314802 RepID=A0A6A6XB96_9PLEO|nr:hypothetical protein K505DRAFT_362382 [Melanomma pulvis-pyrius CBS 109.77]